MDWRTITNWVFKDFNDWLRSNQEDWKCEWKQILDLNSQNVRKTFCAFANTEGGIIIFGVDNSKSIVGVDEDMELNTKISQIVNNGILPAIPGNSWNIKALKIPKRRKKFVYIINISPSAYFVKPHVTDHKIYQRSNGESIPINDGRDIREKFLINKFDPKNIQNLEKDFEKLNNVRFNPDHIDVLYLKSLKEYLEERSIGRNPEFTALSCSLTEIANLYETIKRQQARGNISGESISVLDSSSVLENLSLLSGKIKMFLTKYKEVHNYE